MLGFFYGNEAAHCNILQQIKKLAALVSFKLLPIFQLRMIIMIFPL